jgi:hypothetical protein
VFYARADAAVLPKSHEPVNIGMAQLSPRLHAGDDLFVARRAFARLFREAP